MGPYFLDKADDDVGGAVTNGDDVDEKENEKEWIVSFEKLSFLFPNLKQIHFLNSYRFDDEVLKRLIKWIKCGKCKLEQIKFLYYDFVGSVDQCQYFYDPDSLNGKLKEKLKQLKWEISSPNN